MNIHQYQLKKTIFFDKCYSKLSISQSEAIIATPQKIQKLWIPFKNLLLVHVSHEKPENGILAYVRKVIFQITKNSMSVGSLDTTKIQKFPGETEARSSASMKTCVLTSSMTTHDWNPSLSSWDRWIPRGCSPASLARKKTSSWFSDPIVRQ